MAGNGGELASGELVLPLLAWADTAPGHRVLEAVRPEHEMVGRTGFITVARLVTRE